MVIIYIKTWKRQQHIYIVATIIVVVVVRSPFTHSFYYSYVSPTEMAVLRKGEGPSRNILVPPSLMNV